MRFQDVWWGFRIIFALYARRTVVLPFVNNSDVLRRLARSSLNNHKIEDPHSIHPSFAWKVLRVWQRTTFCQLVAKVRCLVDDYCCAVRLAFGRFCTFGLMSLISTISVYLAIQQWSCIDCLSCSIVTVFGFIFIRILYFTAYSTCSTLPPLILSTSFLCSSFSRTKCDIWFIWIHEIKVVLSELS